MPRISVFIVVVILLAYFAGAKWPVLAQKVGLV
jgi:hypothetical protein